jgi:hypothetical protein
MNPLLGDMLKHEYLPAYCREAVTILSGQNLKIGAILGKVTVGSVTGAAAAGNTGNGTIGSLSAGTGAKNGVYKAVIIEPGTNLGTFKVEDPDGVMIGTGVVGTAFAGAVNFTIADGSTDFVAGDSFNITVALGTEKHKASPHTAADGSEVVQGVLLEDCDASGGDKTAIMLRRGPAIVNKDQLVYDASVDDATKKATKRAGLLALGIVSADAA